MNLITDTWRGLVQRKLWPVALLLIAALVAVPLTLVKEPEVTPVPASTAAAKDEGLPVTYVSSASEEEAAEETTGKRRRTLGDEKDPFEPAPLPKAKKKKAKKTTSVATPTATPGTSSGGPSGGGSTGGASDPVATATPTPTATPAPVPANSIKVRFSRTESADDAKAKTVERLDVLPSTAKPLIVFKGLENGGKVAVFELTGTVTIEGDATCEPKGDDCQVLKLRAGETVFITVADTGEATDAQYQLDLLKINANSTASASKLEKADGDETVLRGFEVVK